MDIFVLVCVAILLVVSVIKIIWEWTEGNTLNIFKLPKLKYFQFLSFYGMNPDRWDLYWNRVARDYNEFRLTVLGYFPYTIFRILEHNRKAEQNKAEATSRLLEDIKRDINQFKQFDK